MEQKEYVKKIVGEFIREITDNLFLYIEQDDERKREYMTNINRFGVQSINMALGAEIGEVLHLEGDGTNTNPKSSLIKNYTFRKPPSA